MLETEPQKRLNIDDVIKNKWIAVRNTFKLFLMYIYYWFLIYIAQKKVL